MRLRFLSPKCFHLVNWLRKSIDKTALITVLSCCAPLSMIINQSRRRKNLGWASPSQSWPNNWWEWIGTAPQSWFPSISFGLQYWEATGENLSLWFILVFIAIYILLQGFSLLNKGKCLLCHETVKKKGQFREFVTWLNSNSKLQIGNYNGRLNCWHLDLSLEAFQILSSALTYCPVI